MKASRLFFCFAKSGRIVRAKDIIRLIAIRCYLLRKEQLQRLNSVRHKALLVKKIRYNTNKKKFFVNEMFFFAYYCLLFSVGLSICYS